MGIMAEHIVLIKLNVMQTHTIIAEIPGVIVIKKHKEVIVIALETLTTVVVVIVLLQ